jgi:hypothetical protein
MALVTRNHPKLMLEGGGVPFLLPRSDVRRKSVCRWTSPWWTMEGIC